MAASLVSESKILSSPASVDSIPTSANREDHVSMGSIAARKAEGILENLQKIIAIELLWGAQALEFSNPQHA
jgi:histidine ammonia-lyase